MNADDEKLDCGDSELFEDFGEKSDDELDSDKEEDVARQELGELGQWVDQLLEMSNDLGAAYPTMDLNAQDLKVEQSSSVAVDGGQQQQQTSTAVRPKVKPAVPPKPPIDTYRFSMANMEESGDVDLDSLLRELCEMGSKLSDSGPDSLFNKWSKNVNGATAPPTSLAAPTTMNGNSLHPSPSTSIHQKRTQPSSSTHSPKSVLSSNGHAKSNASNETATTAPTVNRVLQVLPANEVLQCRAASPDNDSAFCDSVSLTSSESILSSSHRSRDSNGSSADSTRGSMTTPSPTQLLESVQAKIRNVQEEVNKENLTEEERNARIKAEKIKIALEKMKEASVRKLYIKVFCTDGSSKSILVDERWTVGFVLKQLAEKNHVPLTPHHALVESYPDLFMERIYEDHEHLVENISMWTRDSPNKLYFVERVDKFDVFYNPQLYLLCETSSNKKPFYDTTAKQQLLTEFFEPSHVQPPETSGILYLKTDGKKSWKKHYCVLRASGLYYSPKGKTKSPKDLVCLMQLEMVQVYNGVGWRKKYKAPSEFGFALKHPRIQVKASKYVKYLCAEDERTYQKWMAGLRLAKNGRQLFENFVEVCNGLDNDSTPTSSTSSTTFNYSRESVVMRPKLTNSNSSIGNRNSYSGGDRPRSSTEMLLAANSKRNSRTLTHVDVPSVPEEVERRKIFMLSPTMSCRSAVNSMDSNNGAGSDSQTPTPETQSMNGFEAEFTTGTIKRQPTTPCNSGKSTARLSDGPRGILTISSPHRSVLSQQSGDSLSLSGRESRISGEEEADSDEELPPPPPEMYVGVVSNGGDFCDHPHRPPPSPPVKSSLSPNHNVVCLRDQSTRMTSSSDCSRMTSESTQQMASLNLSLRSSRGSIDSQNDTGAADSGDSDSSRSKNRMKRLPPPPPKRSENTRLSVTSVGSPVSPVPSGGASIDRLNDGGERSNGHSIVAPMPIIKMKPNVPAKPKFQHPPQQNMSAPNLAQVNCSGGAPVLAMPAATDAFNSELQRAMQRRLQKMQADETTHEMQAHLT